MEDSTAMIRIGFLGAGHIAALHEYLLATCGVEHAIVAVCDPDPERADAFAARTGAKVMDEAALIEAVDAVYVATWTAEHPRLVEAVAAAGKAVFCEKPLATTLEVVNEMCQVVADAGVTNQVGLILRFLPPFRLVKRLLADERAGRVLSVVFRDDQYLPIGGSYGSTWRIEADKAGHGTVLEHSIHDLDILEWLLGPVATLSAETRNHHGHTDIEDVAAVRVDFTSGAVGTLSSIWHDIAERESQRGIEIFCERLYIRIEGDFVGPVRWHFTGSDPQVAEADALMDEVAGDDDRGNPARTFLTAVAEGRPASPSFADAIGAHELVDAVYRSAALAGAPISDIHGASVAGVDRPTP
jgi:predicted dehydrogenase